MKKIAHKLGCVLNAIRNEIKRDIQILYKGNIKRYKADKGQERYEENHSFSRKTYQYLEKSEFINYVGYHFKEDNGRYSQTILNTKKMC